MKYDCSEGTPKTETQILTTHFDVTDLKSICDIISPSRDGSVPYPRLRSLYVLCRIWSWEDDFDTQSDPEIDKVIVDMLLDRRKAGSLPLVLKGPVQISWVLGWAGISEVDIRFEAHATPSSTSDEEATLMSQPIKGGSELSNGVTG